jgi:hypothetical protein
MLSVLLRDRYCVETVHGGVRDVCVIPGHGPNHPGYPPDVCWSNHTPGILIRFLNGTDIHIPWPGPDAPQDMNKLGGSAGVFVMNEAGKTIARYNL